MIRPTLSVLVLSLALGAAGAQDERVVAYPERNALSPFRTPSDVYAPPDEAFRLLRIMQTLSASRDVAKSVDVDGRELVDDPRWREARAQLLRTSGLDAGYLAQIIRLNRNVADRETAFYASFHVANVDHVFELIAHIPGEPDRRIREQSLPRAIDFVRANLPRRFGDLPDARKQELREAMPKPGSPEAKQLRVLREPIDTDHLHQLDLMPFFQLLDLDDQLDQAQGLWFLKETFAVRADLARAWLEPALPRVKQLLIGDSARVREEAIGLLQVIGPKDLRQPPADRDELTAWADEAAKTLFPPIRNLNDTIVQLFPSPERTAIAAAGVAALETGAVADAFAGARKDGTRYRGVRIVTVPKALEPLALPPEAIVTSVNGVNVTDAPMLLETVRTQLDTLRHPRRLFVEYVLRGEQRAIEYRIM